MIFLNFKLENISFDFILLIIKKLEYFDGFFFRKLFLMVLRLVKFFFFSFLYGRYLLLLIINNILMNLRFSFKK